MNRTAWINLLYVLIAAVAIAALQIWWAAQHKVEVVPYSQFEQWLEDDAIDTVSIRQDQLVGTLKSPLPDGAQRFSTVRVAPEIADRLHAHGVTFTGVIEDTFFRDLLSWVLPVLLFVGIWMFFIRRMAERQGLGGPLSLGRSKAKVYVETGIKVTFADVAGVDEARGELEEIVSFLKRPGEYGRLGARVPKGVLLVGPPGTGKTLLARAVAGEAGVPFFSISGSEFVEMFVGVGAARVRDLFEQAQKAAPSIIFIDELDALGKSRGLGIMGGHDEKEQTLNQLLTELDGFDSRQGIVLLAATNRPEVLDPALLRAGRFDRQILVDRPDRNGRIAILRVHVKKVSVAADVDLDQIAALTPGFTGADLANLVNEAALVATRRGAEAISSEDFVAAIERLVAGIEKKSRVMNEVERRTVAYHEMGHALVAASLPGVDPVQKISIIPRGIGSLGYTIQRPTEDRFLLTRKELINRITVLLGGRAAEAMVIGEISTGAADDLDKATEIARGMVTRFGMSERAGHRVYEPERQAFLEGQGFGTSQVRSYGDTTADTIDAEIRRLVDDGLDAATGILERRRGELDEGARLLLEKEVITVADFPALRPVAANTDGADPG